MSLLYVTGLIVRPYKTPELHSCIVSDAETERLNYGENVDHFCQPTKKY